MRRAIKRAKLIENVHYTVYYQEVENPLGGRPALEHHLTFDAAKHIALMSPSAKGAETRDWFIAKEKELHQVIIDRLKYQLQARPIIYLPRDEWMTIAQFVKHQKIARELPAVDRSPFANLVCAIMREKGIAPLKHRLGKNLYPFPVLCEGWTTFMLQNNAQLFWRPKRRLRSQSSAELTIVSDQDKET